MPRAKKASPEIWRERRLVPVCWRSFLLKEARNSILPTMRTVTGRRYCMVFCFFERREGGGWLQGGIERF